MTHRHDRTPNPRDSQSTRSSPVGIYTDGCRLVLAGAPLLADTTDYGASEPTVSAGVAPATSRRTKAEALGLVLGVFGILLGLALTVGATLPVGR